MPSTLDKIVGKLSDHPNSSADDSVNPSTGAQDTNNGDDPEKTDIENFIQKGQGVGGLRGNDQPDIRAGSLTDSNTASTATGMLEKKN